MLILVRHGESTANKANDNSDAIDTKLTDKGILQAKNIKQILKKYFNIKKVFSSHATRCISTAELCIDMPYEILPDIYEFSNGILDGVKINDIPKIPQIGKKIESDIKKINTAHKLDFIFDKKTIKLVDDFETMIKAERDNPPRLKRALKLAKKYTNKGMDVLFITHGGVIRDYISKLFNINKHTFHIPNASITVIDLKAHRLLLQAYSIQ